MVQRSVGHHVIRKSLTLKLMYILCCLAYFYKRIEFSVYKPSSCMSFVFNSYVYFFIKCKIIFFFTRLLKDNLVLKIVILRWEKSLVPDTKLWPLGWNISILHQYIWKILLVFTYLVYIYIYIQFIRINTTTMYVM